MGIHANALEHFIADHEMAFAREVVHMERSWDTDEG